MNLRPAGHPTRPADRRVSTGAVAAVGRSELRRHWRRLLLVGVAAGILGSAVVGVAVVARRTATAYPRLAEATDAEDASASVFGDPAIVDRVRGLPEVERSTVASVYVGALQGPGIVYLSLRSAPPDALGHPVVVEGRAADPDDPDEVVIVGTLADALALGPGSTLPLCLLTTEEFASFDVGFGEPDGPCAELRVTGIARTAGGDETVSVVAGPAFADAYGEGTRAGLVADLRLHDGLADLSAVEEAAAALSAEFPQREGAEEFPAVAVSTPAERAATADAAARVLVVGLLVCAVVAALVGLLLVGQALGRQFEAEAAEQAIEAALGLTPAERCLARVAPALLTAVVAAAVTAAGGLVAGAVEPLGPLGAMEPRPGWSPNLALTVAGAALVGLTTLGLAALAAWRAGRASRATPTTTRAGRRRGSLLVGGAAATTGLSLALGRGRGRGRLPVRATLATVVVGVAGVTAALTFAASLDRLGAEPSRWGWNADVIVVDARADDVATVAADPRVEAAGWLHQVVGTVDGGPVTLYAFEEPVGDGPGWTLLAGTEPLAPDEVVLGPQLADALGVGQGDEIHLALADGGTRALRVTGLGIGPAMGSEGFAGSALVAPAALEGAATTGSFDELLVRAAPGADPEELIAALGERYELSTPEPPRSVQDVLDLDRIPDLLALYLGVVALAALGNGLAVVVRRRSRDLAVLRAVGLTPRQVVRAVVAAALATAAVGVVVGVPLGVGLGRLVWWLVADPVGLATDVTVPTAGVVAVIVGALLVATAAAVVPAARAARLRPGLLLHTE